MPIEVDEFTQQQLEVLWKLSDYIDEHPDLFAIFDCVPSSDVRQAVDFARGEIVAKLYAEEYIRELEEDSGIVSQKID